MAKGKGKNNGSAAETAEPPLPTRRGGKRAMPDVTPPEEALRVKKKKPAAVTKTKARRSEEAEAADGHGSHESVSKGKRTKRNYAPRGKAADEGGAAAGDAVEAAATAARGFLVVHTPGEFLQRTAAFAPGSVLLSIANESSLCDASVFWKFVTARRIRKGSGFELKSIGTLVHKAAALRYLHGQIDGLTSWHNSLGSHVDHLSNKLKKIDAAADESASSSSSWKSTRWPLDGVKFYLQANPEVVLAAEECAAEMKRSIDLEPQMIENYKQNKFLPLLGLPTPSSTFPAQFHLSKETSPHPLAQKQMRAVMRRVNEIQRDALEKLQQTLFNGILELRNEVSGATFLGCGPTDYAEFSDGDEN